MRLTCFECSKSVSNEVPNDTVLRAIAICPECIEKFVEIVQRAGSSEESPVKEKEND